MENSFFKDMDGGGTLASFVGTRRSSSSSDETSIGESIVEGKRMGGKLVSTLIVTSLCTSSSFFVVGGREGKNSSFTWMGGGRLQKSEK